MHLGQEDRAVVDADAAPLSYGKAGRESSQQWLESPRTGQFSAEQIHIQCQLGEGWNAALAVHLLKILMSR